MLWDSAVPKLLRSRPPPHHPRVPMWRRTPRMAKVVPPARPGSWYPSPSPSDSLLSNNGKKTGREFSGGRIIYRSKKAVGDSKGFLVCLIKTRNGPHGNISEESMGFFPAGKRDSRYSAQTFFQCHFFPPTDLENDFLLGVTDWFSRLIRVICINLPKQLPTYIYTALLGRISIVSSRSFGVLQASFWRPQTSVAERGEGSAFFWAQDEVRQNTRE